MRSCWIALFLIAACAHAQGVPDAFDVTRRFADTGAAQLALSRVERLQPDSPAASRWSDWEQLRCGLLKRLERNQDLVQRVAAQPAGTASRTARFCLLQGARAAIATAQGEMARTFLARLIWLHEPPADDEREARQLVIESYFAERKPRDAYALMLRYQQDYKSFERDVLARYAEALMSAGMEAEAVNWLSQLDDASAVKAMLRLKTGLLAPDAAVAQARSALAAGAHAAYWTVIQQAGVMQKNRALQVEALEHLVEAAGARAPQSLAAELWNAYTAAARETANENKLLLGDDAGWADFASRLAAASPSVARAFFATVAAQGNAGTTRENAQLQLVYALQSAGLASTALRLFDDSARLPVAQIDAHARYLLGGMALERGLPALAAHFWLGLATPPAVDADEWHLQLAQALLRSGEIDAGARVLGGPTARKGMLPAQLVERLLPLVRQLQEGGAPKVADSLYRELLPSAGVEARRQILFGLARGAEAAGDFQQAAAGYLEAALQTDERTPDGLAINARMAAATSLARAGFKDDARAQFGWLQKNVKDAEKLEAIRRELLKF